MNILHVIPSLDLADGGPTFAVRSLAESVARQGAAVTIIATESDGTRRPSAAATTERVDQVFGRRNTKFYKVSFDLARWLKRNIRNFDVVHIHALFSFSSTIAAHYAHRAGVPYIIRPLGVLNQWGLKNRRALLKSLSLSFIEKRILTHAAAIHYTSEAERSEASKIGNWMTKIPSFVIPLPVETRQAEGEEQRAEGKRHFLSKFSAPLGERIVLFLSRIHPKKGIELLLEAFAEVKKEGANAALVIAGSGDQNYEARLRQKASDLGITEAVAWTGFVDGEEKAVILSAADIFVLPSFSENFGIAAAEALAAGVPCILSDQVAIADDVGAAGAAVVTKCDVPEIANAIRDLLQDDGKRSRLGVAGQAFANERFSMDSVGRQLATEYRAVLKR